MLAMCKWSNRAAVDIAHFGFEDEEDAQRARARPVEGLRALVHGHFTVDAVERSENRWNLDTGAGFPNGRLSLLEVNSKELRSWTFDVDES